MVQAASDEEIITCMRNALTAAQVPAYSIAEATSAGCYKEYKHQCMARSILYYLVKGTVGRRLLQ